MTALARQPLFDVAKGPRGTSHPRREPYALRDHTFAQELLHKRGITHRDIADESDVPLATVARALSRRTCGRTMYESVLRVRWAAYTMLLREGWQGFPEELWDEYDATALEGMELGVGAVAGMRRGYTAAELKAGGTD